MTILERKAEVEYFLASIQREQDIYSQPYEIPCSPIDRIVAKHGIDLYAPYLEKISATLMTQAQSDFDLFVVFSFGLKRCFGQMH